MPAENQPYNEEELQKLSKYLNRMQGGDGGDGKLQIHFRSQ